MHARLIVGCQLDTEPGQQIHIQEVKDIDKVLAGSLGGKCFAQYSAGKGKPAGMKQGTNCGH